VARLASEDFDAVFDSFTRTAFRLETLPHYAVPIEADAYADFLAGRPYDLTWHHAWLDTMHRKIRQGQRVQRVRVMDEPPTPYQRFELAVTPHNLDIGEDIRVIVRSTAVALALPACDFWLFDDQRVVSMDFDAHGVLKGAEVTDDPSRVASCQAARDLALAHAMTYAVYWDGPEASEPDGRLG
jgi:hypothetical protein